MIQEPQSVREIEANFKREYAALSESEDLRIIQGFQRFLRIERHKSDLKSQLHEAALTISRLFPFREVSIGIKDQSDHLYRYVEVIGFSPSAKAEHMKLAYTHEEMFDREKYPWIKISRYTDFRYAEGEQVHHSGEEKSFTRPSLLTVRRHSPKQMLERDYFDVYLLSEKDEVIGWIEVAATRDGNMPSMRTIRWLELFAMLMSPIVERELHQG